MKQLFKITNLTVVVLTTIILLSGVFVSDVKAQVTVCTSSVNIPTACNSANGCTVSNTASSQCELRNGRCQVMVNNGCRVINNVCQVDNTPTYKDCCSQVLKCVKNTDCVNLYGGTLQTACDVYTSNCQLPIIPANCDGTGGGGATSTPAPPTSTPTLTAQCQNILAYNSNWVLLTSAQLSQTKSGDMLNYCVTGFGNTGTFDMARFTINNTLYANTTLIRPGTTADYCQSYTVPTGVYSFNIVGEVHNTTLGWVQ